MKLLRTVCLSLFITGTAINHSVTATTNPAIVKLGMYPDKTIVIKNPQFTNTTSFFSGNTVFMFEVYKAGNATDVNKIIKSFLEDPKVLSCVQGPVTGDFTSITLALKSNADKTWFIAQFKKAGLNTIKINNAGVVNVDDM